MDNEKLKESWFNFYFDSELYNDGFDFNFIALLCLEHNLGNKTTLSVEWMCKVLGISKQQYYDMYHYARCIGLLYSERTGIYGRTLWGFENEKLESDDRVVVHTKNTQKLLDAGININPRKVVLASMFANYTSGGKAYYCNYNYLADKFKCNERTMKRYMKELMDCNLISKVGIKNGKTGYLWIA